MLRYSRRFELRTPFVFLQRIHHNAFQPRRHHRCRHSPCSRRMSLPISAVHLNSVTFIVKSRYWSLRLGSSVEDMAKKIFSSPKVPVFSSGSVRRRQRLTSRAGLLANSSEGVQRASGKPRPDKGNLTTRSGQCHCSDDFLSLQPRERIHWPLFCMGRVGQTSDCELSSRGVAIAWQSHLICPRHEEYCWRCGTSRGDT